MMFWLGSDESQRLKHIAHVLFENHLGSILTKIGLRQALPFTKRIKTEHFNTVELTPQLVRKIMEDLDGSFIKLGQLLSLRPDLLPIEYCEELSKLQDQVKHFPGSQAKEIIEKELGKSIHQLFSEFDDKPTAAASMGQVHIAKLKDGTRVAVKVQRPNVQETIKLDIKLLYRVAYAIKKRYGTSIIDPVEIVSEFERYTESELNYLKEAHHVDLFNRNFAKSESIVIPKVFWTHTTSKVLTLEYISGKRLTDSENLTPVQKKKIVQKIISSEFEQIFVHGVFHADPHPGNFIIKRNGQVALLDFGIIGRMDVAMRENITALFTSMINKDGDGMANAVIRLGIAVEGTDTNKIKQDIYQGLEEYYGIGLDKLRLSKALQDIINILKANKMKVSPNFVLLAKATLTLEGLAKKIYPKLVLVDEAKPFVKRLAREKLDPRKVAERARRKVGEMLEFAESIPRKTNALLTEMQDADRDLRKIDKDISILATEIDKSSNRLTLGFLAGTLFIASTILLPFMKTDVFGIPTLSVLGYIIGLVILIVIFISILRERKI